MSSNRKRGRQPKVDQYADDGFLVEDEDGPPLSKRKDVKKEAKSAGDAKTGKKEVQLGKRKYEDGAAYWELSSQRRVTVSEFKGKSMVNIREYYEKDGKSLPGRKGISLSLEQYSTLLSVLPDVEAVLSEKGEQVPRPNYEGSGGPTQEDEPGDDEENDAGADADGGARKNNHEATSDEEE
ncbi:PC4-domain-containing protein [Saccharata proteae CBS 121410]|uniref:PC4-domain-containing protein n=1 Tax=Saccharata proteae CBS 121410 TaxID=1314787 RepID=A0A9P4LXW3_9PEZI|nr:PC4-domain-containing protein [Saccharata proteae CBS 121410]